MLSQNATATAAGLALLASPQLTDNFPAIAAMFPTGLHLSIWVALPLGAAAQDEKKTFYWVSHGAPTDPVWTYFLQGAEMWAEATGNTVNTSFHSGDVPSHQEAIRAAIAAGADGIVSSRFCN